MKDLDLDYYKSLLKIDKNALDDAIEEQAVLYHEICEHYALAVSLRDEAHENVKTVDAELNQAIRNNAQAKITEAAIASMVTDSEEHKKAMHDYLQSKLTVDMLAALRDSFNQRSYMIKELCALYAAEYFVRINVKEGKTKTATKNYESTRERMKKLRTEK